MQSTALCAVSHVTLCSKHGLSRNFTIYGKTNEDDRGYARKKLFWLAALAADSTSSWCAAVLLPQH
jgi:hypothetical protein